jgi:hypothetical protein
MPTASVKPYLSDDRTRVRLRPEALLAIAVVAALIVVAVIASALRPGPFVGRVKLVNHSEYAFDVDVAGKSANDWMPLGTVADHTTASIGSVFDQGAAWTFRFSVQGHEVGTIVENRGALADAGWVVDVPDRFVSTLRDQAVAPTG